MFVASLLSLSLLAGLAPGDAKQAEPAPQDQLVRPQKMLPQDAARRFPSKPRPQDAAGTLAKNPRPAYDVGSPVRKAEPPPSPEEIAELTAKAEAGDAKVLYRLGNLHHSGLGVPRDYVAAMSYYRQAAQKGHPDAFFAMGLMYYLGEGERRDYNAAVSWFRKAVDHGVGEARYRLGGMYAMGMGVPRSYVEAYMWFDLSVAVNGTGNDDDFKAREAMALQMTPEEVARAQALARAWKPVRP